VLALLIGIVLHERFLIWVIVLGSRTVVDRLAEFAAYFGEFGFAGSG
jgi:hypothetical protein